MANLFIAIARTLTSCLGGSFAKIMPTEERSAGPGPGLGRGDPAVLLEVGVDREVLVWHAPARRLGRDLELLGHREDRIGLANRPALDELAGGGRFALALRAALIDPGQ